MSESSPVKDRIVQKLQDNFAPQRLEVIDESHRHAGHAGHDPRGESHFEVLIVSESFAGCSRLERHRMIYVVLAEELADRVHALSLKAFSPSEVKF